MGRRRATLAETLSETLSVSRPCPGRGGEANPQQPASTPCENRHKHAQIAWGSAQSDLPDDCADCPGFCTEALAGAQKPWESAQRGPRRQNCRRSAQKVADSPECAANLAFCTDRGSSAQCRGATGPRAARRRRAPAASPRCDGRPQIPGATLHLCTFGAWDAAGGRGVHWKPREARARKAEQGSWRRVGRRWGLVRKQKKKPARPLNAASSRRGSKGFRRPESQGGRPHAPAAASGQRPGNFATRGIATSRKVQGWIRPGHPSVLPAAAD